VLQERLHHERPAALLYFASSHGDLPAIAAQIAATFPGVPSAGCTTCGEVGPAGCTNDSVSIAVLRAPCRAAVTLVPSLSSFRLEQGADVLQTLAADLGLSRFELKPNRHVLITLTDGLSGAEEILIAALSEHSAGLPLVGGSAGDDFRFERTLAAANGATASDAAAVMLLEPNVPFREFHLHHYTATARDTVVTDAEPSKRLVRRLDGYPATRVLSELLAVREAELIADGLRIVHERSPVFGFRAAGELHLRSVMNVQNGQLLMGGAVETGTILHPMRAGDLIERTRQGVQAALDAVHDSSGLLLFNCAGRLFEATVQDRVAELASAMQSSIAAGFTTYGEQFGPLQVNHTLTGLALGKAST